MPTSQKVFGQGFPDGPDPIVSFPQSDGFHKAEIAVFTPEDCEPIVRLQPQVLTALEKAGW
jgi:hypothetical protein